MIIKLEIPKEDLNKIAEKINEFIKDEWTFSSFTVRNQIIELGKYKIALHKKEGYSHDRQKFVNDGKIEITILDIPKD